MPRCAVSTRVNLCVSACQPKGGHSRGFQLWPVFLAKTAGFRYTPIKILWFWSETIRDACRMFYCPQAFLSLDFQCRDDVSELN